MQLLPDGKVRIQNTQTGEFKDIDPIELPKYNPGLVNEYQSLKSQQKPVQPATPQEPTTLNPEQEVKKSLSSKVGEGVINVVKGIAKPFVQTGKTIAGAGYEGVRAAKSAMGDKNAYVNQKTGEVVQNPFISEEELAGARDITDPEGILRKQMTSSAEVGSWAVPFGKGKNIVTKAVLPGAVVGAAQGLDGEVTPESVVGNAALGALGGTVLYGASKAKGALKGVGKATENVGSEVRSGVTKIRVKPSVYGASEEKAIKKTLEDLGIKGSPQKQYEMLEPAMKKINGEIEEYLVKNPGQVSKKLIEDKFSKNIRSSLRTKEITDKVAKAEMDGYLQDLMQEAGAKSDNIATKDLFNMKKMVNADYSKIADKLENGTPLTPREKVIQAFRKSLDDTITSIHPEIKNKTVQQSRLYDAATSISRERSAVPTVRLPTGATLPSPTLKSGQDLIGRGLQKTGKATQTAAEFLPDINPYVSGQVGSRAMLQQPGDQPDQKENAIDYNISGNQPDGNLDHTPIIPQTETPQYLNPYNASPEIIYREYQNALNAGDKTTASRLRTMYEDEVSYQKNNSPSAKKLTEKQAQYSSAGEIAQQALDLLNAGSAKTGVGVSFAKNLKRVTGMVAPEQTDFYSKLSLARGMLLNALSGANVPPSEYERLSSLLDIENSTPEVAKQQLKSFIEGVSKLKETSVQQPTVTMPDMPTFGN